jgi:hypothetical protein
MTQPMLPKPFAALEPFAAMWCLATEAERYARRLDSTMIDMQAFHDAGMPRLREIMAYLDRFELPDLPEQELHLLYLAYSLIMVSLPIEVWAQPRVVDAGTAYFDRNIEPVP